mgnify:CR=1 FL=1
MSQYKDNLTENSPSEEPINSSLNVEEVSPGILRRFAPKRSFDRSVILQQTPHWSRGVVAAIVGVTTLGIIWANVAKIEQVIPARGQLKPQGSVKEVQAPLSGVVQEVYVEEGDQVEANQVLLKLDSTASAKELVSLKKIQKNLQQENKFYQNLIQQSLDAYQVEVAIARLKLPQTVADLTSNRATLITENRLFGGLVNQGMGAINLSAEQFARLQATRKEVISRATAAQIEVQKLHKQLNQNQVQLAEARVQLAKDQQVLGDIDVRNQLIQAQARESLRIEQEILDNVSPLLDEGAIPQLQIKKQQQQVNDRYAALVEDRGNGAIEYERQQQQIENRLAEIQQLNEEQQRLQLAISQAEVQLTNTTALAEREIRDKIANNEQRIAEIDSQLTKIVIENEKRIAELDSQILSLIHI